MQLVEVQSKVPIDVQAVFTGPKARHIERLPILRIFALASQTAARNIRAVILTRRVRISVTATNSWQSAHFCAALIVVSSDSSSIGRLPFHCCQLCPPRPSRKMWGMLLAVRARLKRSTGSRKLS